MFFRCLHELHSNPNKLLSRLCYKAIIPDNHKTLIKLIYNIILGSHNEYYCSLLVPGELMIYLLFYVNCVFYVIIYVNNCIYMHESVTEINNQIATFDHMIMLIMKLYMSVIWQNSIIQYCYLQSCDDINCISQL